MKPPTETAVIIIPTYNEAKNIGKMIVYLNEKIFPSLDKKWQMKILVVDGNSPDGTGKVVQNYAKKYKNTYLYTETSKDGIGAAYLKGFKYALDNLGADYVFEFDGDFQHPPEAIPVMLKAMDEGYDYVIGSRKIKGGSNPKGWGLKRVFYSDVGGWIARFILFFPFKNFWRVTDPTTGLKVTRVKGFIDRMDLDWQGDRLLTKSFGYKLQLLYETLQMGAKFKEIPLQFQVRNAGESKIESRTAKEIFRVVLLLRWRDEFTQKFVKFALVGGLGFVINVVGAKIFKNLLIKPGVNLSLLNGICNALAAEISIISNFIWNNVWTFAREKITSFKLLLSKFITFNLSSILTGIIIPSIGVSLLTALFGDHLFLYQVIVIFGLTVPLNWLVYNRVIWKKKEKVIRPAK
ncbi:MAG TPA: glycosyltransferase [Candidatus Woesebacteria bacterium]|nr:glycosyltransferase [Candidatus Woesebacteria bacterium]HRT39738.1 glycosyltransferase [Candidatus Woesebacteria bacterium]